ncbi:putative tetracenomycin C resistance and export protein [Wickerhamomyces ciferrii]|uniref:Tetracenomycin C resistance and export protein n=1 Tax=Wickerhamomyces ciferrii (strain ATCC 14091 / BCRC 22168 / CBS 111 / JCM 3599 / NBRC 0793 / NRRL Y-1031 F-60-10) TaxID=1206466 RepID=K0KJT2_WICCF|nr:putative tetracenomycin C resistance and export protein [Wickerhamomyces ciferrii]CCH41724.1 putative tetracenomycin C resistance and export protein [Wickerhamomyces ciferrii]
MIKSFNKAKSLVPMNKRNKQLVYAIVLLNTALDNMNVSGTMTSVFSITNHFQSTTTTTSWILAAYALTLGACIIISGKLSDVLGAHNIFIYGLFGQSIMALITAVIDDQIIVLIVFRALQGVFASTLIPAAFSITGNYFQGKALSKAISFLLMAVTASLGVGLILGGAFSETNIGYKGLYYFTFALGFTSSIFLFFYAIPITPTKEHEQLKIKNLDFGGSVLLVTGLILMILGLTEGGESWKDPVSYVPLIIGGLTTIGVILFEMVYIQNFKNKVDRESTTLENKDDEESLDVNINSKKKDWRYNLELLFPGEVARVPNFPQYVISSFFYYMCLISVTTTNIQYNQYVTLDSPIICGLKALPISLGLLTGATIYRHHIAKKAGVRLVYTSSAIITITMTVWISRLNFQEKNSYWKYECFGQYFFGYGINLYFQVLWNDYSLDTPLHLQGVVSGILQTAGQIGICFGNTIIATINGDIHSDKSWENRIELHDKFKKNYYLVYAACGLAFFVFLTMKSGKPQVEQTEQSSEQSIEESSQNKEDS